MMYNPGYSTVAYATVSEGARSSDGTSDLAADLTGAFKVEDKIEVENIYSLDYDLEDK